MDESKGSHALCALILLALATTTQAYGSINKEPSRSTWVTTQVETASHHAERLWIPRNQILCDNDLFRRGYLLKGTTIHEGPSASSPTKRSPRHTDLVMVYSRSDRWIETSLGWVDESDLLPDPTDGGFLVTRYSQTLRANASEKAQAVTSLPAGEKLIPIKSHKLWVKVRATNAQGWVKLTGNYTKLDFAESIEDMKGRWHKVLDYSGDGIAIEGDKQIPVFQLKAIKTDSQWAIVMPGAKLYQFPSLSSALHFSPPVGQKISIQSTTTVQPPLPIDAAATIFNQPIFDMASRPHRPQEKLLSAHGIYWTEDGQTWTSLKRLGHRNFPVAIARDGTWFIGPYQSPDHGEHLYPYIRWDRLIWALMQHYRLVPIGLRLKSIQLDGKQSLLHLVVTSEFATGTGDINKELALWSADGGSSWDVTSKHAKSRRGHLLPRKPDFSLPQTGPVQSIAASR